MRLPRIAIALALLCGVADAQQAKKPPTADGDVLEGDTACFKLTKSDGSTLKVLAFEKVGHFYKITDAAGAVSQLFETSVKSIRAQKAAECEAFVEISPAASSSEHLAGLARTSAREKARSAARMEARTTFSPAFNSGAGFTSGGSELHVGPRGGIYHITSGGNKSYHSR